jgi:nucleotide-binding universal stress UspA family protein
MMHAATLARPTPPHSVVGIHDLLFATDLSPDSAAAFDHVRLLAERFSAEVTLYHGVEVLDDRYPGWWTASSRNLWAEVERWTREALQERAARLSVPASVRVECVRSARQAVLDMVRGRRPDLTVMAAHDHGMFAHLTGASVTENVVDHVHTPVLAVRGKGGLPYRRILVPTDLSLRSRLAFPMAALLARSFDAEVLGLYVAAPLSVATLSGIPAAVPAAPPSEAALWEFLRSDFAGLPVIAQVHVGPVWERIVHAAAEEEIDLIVMATRGHDSFSDRVLGSNTERVVRHAPCPVLVA